MNKWLRNINRLGFKLTLCAVACICAGLCVFALIRFASSAVSDELASSVNFEQNINRRAAQRIQQYVTKNGITLDRAGELGNIRGMDGEIMIVVYKDGVMIYDSFGIAWQDEMPGTLCDLTFADGTAQAYIWDFSFYTTLFYVCDMIGVALAFVTFLALFIRLIRKKLRYLLLLERELAILEGGQLDYSITVEGNDELSSLARGIDDMRRSFIERQRGEAEAIEANQTLISAMSHDLRTPLTSLMGYLALIQNKQYDSQAQFDHFIRACVTKAMRIKEMTDELFEYSVCAGGEIAMKLESFDAYELLMQLISEYGSELERAGFPMEVKAEPFCAQIRVDAGLMARVFDNIISNMKKYAKPSAPIAVFLEQRRTFILLRVENEIAEKQAAQSNCIGLKTCESIFLKHNGKFSARREGKRFIMKMELPVWDIS